jgi:hypothetical protein
MTFVIRVSKITGVQIAGGLAREGKRLSMPGPHSPAEDGKTYPWPEAASPLFVNKLKRSDLL